MKKLGYRKIKPNASIGCKDTPISGYFVISVLRPDDSYSWNSGEELGLYEKASSCMNCFESH